MRPIHVPLNQKWVPVMALVALMVVGAPLKAQIEKDPHRPVCTDARCRKIKSFLKAHYCGESPYGNGPDDGCLIQAPKKPRPGVIIKASFSCAWSETKQAALCHQNGQPPSAIREALIRELRNLGLPAKANGQIYFTIWESPSSGWSIAEAYYSRAVGSDLELCQVIVAIDKSSKLLVLRNLPFQKTDVDVPSVTQWSLIDLADIDADGQWKIILEGDAYENHWLEVVSLQNGSPHTVFSGLGYYL